MHGRLLARRFASPQSQLFARRFASTPPSQLLARRLSPTPAIQKHFASSQLLARRFSTTPEPALGEIYFDTQLAAKRLQSKGFSADRK
jgi:hypothetical protein